MLSLVLAVMLDLQGRQPAAYAKVKQLIGESGADVAVAYRTLDGREELLIDADKPFHAASTMKVPVMIELYRQAQQKLLSLDEPLMIRNEFRSVVDGSAYSLDEGDDSDKEVYASVGKTMTLRRLCELMITVSSNFAANLLIERLGVENVRKTVARLGADGMQVLRGVEDDKAFQKGLNNTTTARGLLILFEQLAHGRAVDPESDKAMIDVLTHQAFNDAIPAQLPLAIRVAHKTGSITRIQHDGGIVFAERPYVLVVLVRGIDDETRSKALIAEISRAVYSQ
jgi:beta-lactamase class A